MREKTVVKSDVVVIGGGIAGCMAAIEVKNRGLEVIVVDKTYSGKSGASITPPAGMLCFDPEWGVEFDTVFDAYIKDGEYLNNQEWTKNVIGDSLQIHKDMEAWGVKFPPMTPEIGRNISPPYTNTQIPFRGISPVLRKECKKRGVIFYDHIMCVELLAQDKTVNGITGFSTDTGEVFVFLAKAVVMAGGGNSFKPTGMPVSMLTGDAESMAYRAGASIGGKEFVNITHPTRADYPSALFAFKCREGNGLPFGHFVDSEGKEHYWANLEECPGTNGTEPDLSMFLLAHEGKGPFFKKFPKGTNHNAEKNIFQPDITPSDEFEMVGGSATGYANCGTGGIWVHDSKCSTDLKGLFAAGDCAGTMHNGALLVNVGGGTGGAASTGKRAGQGAAEYAMNTDVHSPDSAGYSLGDIFAPLNRDQGFTPRWVTEQLQNVMLPYYVTYIKHGDRMNAALTMVEFIGNHLVPKMYANDFHELRLVYETKNMVLLAEMILRSSIFRTESRGIHFREDFPERNDGEWLAWSRLKEVSGKMALEKVDLPMDWKKYDEDLPYGERYPKRFLNENA